MTTHSNALIVFVKNPVLGKVKTRLAATIGAVQALNFYLQLVNHTMTVATAAMADLIICYSDFIPKNDAWSALDAHRCLQVGNDLGECMDHALSEALKTYKQAVLIGSDCAELTTDILDTAFEYLTSVDVAIGPALDGGYYLVGATQPVPGIFVGVEWSTDRVLYQTISKLIDSGLNFGLGVTLRDVDVEGDLESLMAANQ